MKKTLQGTFLKGKQKRCLCLKCLILQMCFVGVPSFLKGIVKLSCSKRSYLICGKWEFWWTFLHTFHFKTQNNILTHSGWEDSFLIGRNTVFAFLSYSIFQMGTIFANPIGALERSLGCEVLWYIRMWDAAEEENTLILIFHLHNMSISTLASVLAWVLESVSA